MHSRGGGYCPVTQILESPSRDIRFLKVKILGIPWGHRPQRGEDLSGTDIYHFVHFHSDRHKMTVPRQKYTFSLADSPRGLLSFVFVIRENDMIMYRPWRHVYCCNDVTFIVVIICIQFFSFVPLSLLSQSQRRHSMEWANFNPPLPTKSIPLDRSTKKSAQYVHKKIRIPNLVQIYRLRASGKMGEI